MTVHELQNARPGRDERVGQVREGRGTRQLEPFFIARIWGEVVGVTFDIQARVSEDAGELQTQVAIREEDDTQAARPYTTARSTSSVVRS